MKSFKYPVYWRCVSSETFSFVLTGEDGSRWFCYCRKILVSVEVFTFVSESLTAYVCACVMTWQPTMCLLNISEEMWISTCESQTINHFWINDREQEEFHNFPLSFASQGELFNLFKMLFKTHFFKLKLCGISAFSILLVFLFIIVNIL